jgi:hypothetical protein
MSTSARHTKLAGLAIAIATCTLAVGPSCGGTTGHEGLTAEGPPEIDASVGEDARDARAHRDVVALEVSLDDGFFPDNVAPIDVASDAWRSDGPACDACLAMQCVADGVPYPPCSAVTGVATDGPMAGTPRADLCKAVYACIERTKCHASGTASPCYCGTVSGAACLNPGAANGVCKSQIEAGEESTDPSAIVTGFANVQLGAGAAIAALQCAIDECFDVCVADSSADR